MDTKPPAPDGQATKNAMDMTPGEYREARAQAIRDADAAQRKAASDGDLKGAIARHSRKAVP